MLTNRSPDAPTPPVPCPDVAARRTVLTAAALALTASALAGCGRRDASAPPPGAYAFDTAVRAATVLGGTEIERGVPAEGAAVEHTITAPDGPQRTYHLYVPTARRGDQTEAGAAPLLLALHGGGGSGTQFEEQSRFDELAEANGFLVAYPDGTPLTPLRRARVWNGGRCCGPAADGVDDAGDPDDVAFLVAVIDDIAATHAVDPDRVFVTGHSNGSIMAVRLACERADRIAAVASQAGPLVTDDGACRPSRPVSVVALHGTADANVPYEGGAGKRTGDLVFPPAEDNITRLAAAEGCAGQAEVLPPPAAGDPVRILRWTRCGDRGVTVGLVAVEGAAHAWMGAEARRTPLGILDSDPFPGFDSSAAVWSFLAAHPRPAGGAG